MHIYVDGKVVFVACCFLAVFWLKRRGGALLQTLRDAWRR